MFACVRRPALAALLSAIAMSATAVPAGADPYSMKVNGLTNPPVGYLDFCRSFPRECASNGLEQAQRLTAGGWRELNEINTGVNRAVAPVTDLDLYGNEEVWTLPASYGDCEDYVLLKRKRLVERGWPTGALLVAVVFDEIGDGHAVLLVRTDRGDFVLDNKTDEVRAWYDTAYRFVKRQSVSDPNRWVSVGDPRWMARNTAAAR
jgi:predicted transglutaminase-like cysteine proteinase